MDSGDQATKQESKSGISPLLKESHLEPLLLEVTDKVLKELRDRQLKHIKDVAELQQQLSKYDEEEEQRYTATEEGMQKITQVYGEQERIIEIAEYVAQEQEIMKQLEDQEVDKEREIMDSVLSSVIDKRMDKIFSRAQYLRANMEKRQYDYFASLKFAEMIKSYAGKYKFWSTHFGTRLTDFGLAIFQTSVMIVVRTLLIFKVLFAYFGDHPGIRTFLFCLLVTNLSINIYLQRSFLDLTFLGKVVRTFQRIIMRTDLLIIPKMLAVLWWPVKQTQLGVEIATEALVQVWKSGLRLIPERFAAGEIVGRVLSIVRGTAREWRLQDTVMFRWWTGFSAMIDYALCPYCSTWDVSVLKSVLCIYNSGDSHEAKNCSSLTGLVKEEASQLGFWLGRRLLDVLWGAMPWNWWKVCDHVEDGIVKFKRDVLDAYAND